MANHIWAARAKGQKLFHETEVEEEFAMQFDISEIENLNSFQRFAERLN